jgi:hypothetical protein
MATATLSELLRTPKVVIARTEEGLVTVTRRGAPDLVLASASTLRRDREGAALAAGILRTAWQEDGDIQAALERLFGWTSLLSPAELSQYAADIRANLWAALELGNYENLLLEHHRWLETAETYAAGLPRGDGSDQDWLAQRSALARP